MPELALGSAATWKSARLLLIDFTAYAGWRRLAAAAALILFGAIFEGVGILLIVPIVPMLLGETVPEGRFEWLPPALAGPEAITVLLLGLAGLLLMRAAVLIARDVHIARMQHGYVEATKRELFERLASANWPEVVKLDHARLIKALGSDMMQLAIAAHYALQAATGSLVLLALMAFAFVLSPPLALLAVGLLLPAAMMGLRWLQKAAGHGAALINHDRDMTVSASQFLAGLKFAVAQNLQQEFLGRYAEASRATVSNRVAFVRLVSVGRHLASLLAVLAAILAVAVAVTVVDVGQATLIAFIVLLSRMTAPVTTIQQGAQQVAHGLPTFDELRALSTSVKRQPLAILPHSAQSHGKDGTAISFRSVSYLHQSDDVAPPGGVNDISLEILPGTLLGISGACGSGKTTLLDLAALLVAPDRGQVLVDGQSITCEEVARHRGDLAYLGSDPVIFSGTVRSNLQWAMPGSTDSAMWAALASAGSDQMLTRIESGLDSPLEASGSNLSGGERQQIAFARVFLRRPRLVLLDEATFSLDSGCERQVLANLKLLDPKPTIVLVSHDRATLAQCERIIALAGGVIISDETPSSRRPVAAQRLTA